VYAQQLLEPEPLPACHRHDNLLLHLSRTRKRVADEGRLVAQAFPELLLPQRHDSYGAQTQVSRAWHIDRHWHGAELRRALYVELGLARTSIARNASEPIGAPYAESATCS
jgi:hypothetical protein